MVLSDCFSSTQATGVHYEPHVMRTLAGSHLATPGAEALVEGGSGGRGKWAHRTLSSPRNLERLEE